MNPFHDRAPEQRLCTLAEREQMIHDKVASLPASARLVHTFAHQAASIPADSTACVCEFDTGHLFRVVVNLKGITGDQKSKVESAIASLVLIAQSRRQHAEGSAA